VGALAENGARSVLGRLSAVTVHTDHPVEHQVQVRASLALPNEGIAGPEGGEGWLTLISVPVYPAAAIFDVSSQADAKALATRLSP